MIDSIIRFVWTPIKDYMYKESKYVLSWEENMIELEKEKEVLSSKREDLQSKVDAVDRQGKKPTSEAELLLKSAKLLLDESEGIEARYKKMSKCLAGLPLDLISGYQLSKRVESNLLPEAKRLIADISKVITNVARAESMPQHFDERIVSEALGTEMVLEQLRRHVKNENVRIIGVYGMMGVGKTELLGELNNQLQELKLDYIIWVDMPQDSSVDTVQKIVGQWLGITWRQEETKERARLIARQLRKSNFVLILDEVWKPLDLAKVGIPIPRRPTKSNIILTTRIEGICSEMNADEKVLVKCMESGEAWKLFEEKVGKQQQQLINSNNDIFKHAKELVGKCGGLPLALIRLGQAMSSRKTVHEWDHARTTMDISPWELLGMDIFSERLRLSYDNLPNDKLRTCLLYCSLYPEGFSIRKEWIIDYCIGEGIIDDIFINMQEIYNKGYEMLGVLEAVSLLEPGDGDKKNYVKMHPVVRGLALWVACDCGERPNKWLVRPQSELHEAPAAIKWKEAERVSLMRNKIAEISEIPDCPNLQTLMLQRNSNLAKICDDFFKSMTRLRVLDLSHTSITKLPAGIGQMTELRYLDLCGTKIKELPIDLGELKQLRFLLLSVMPYLSIFPEKVILSLTNLQVFYMHNSYACWNVGSIGSGVDFDELDKLEQLTALGITIQTVAALHRLAQSDKLANCTRHLHIRACQGLTTFDMPWTLLGSSFLRRLQTLQLSHSDELKEVVISSRYDRRLALYGKGYALPNLETLTLRFLRNAKIFCRHQGWVRDLRQLNIYGSIEMEHLIYLDNDQAVTVKQEEDGGQTSVAATATATAEVLVIDVFPNLKEIRLVNLQKLKSLTQERIMLAFPSLEILHVRNCPKFKKLELIKAENLKEIQGYKPWWNGLEWEDDHMKSSLLPLLKPLRPGGRYD